MASQVLSGTGNVSYTNNTGQNVRIVINYMGSVSSPGSNPTITINWGGGGASVSGQTGVSYAIGRNLAFTALVGGQSISAGLAANNGFLPPQTGSTLPTELMLAPGQTFSATCGAYNIVVIPEAG